MAHPQEGDRVSELLMLCIAVLAVVLLLVLVWFASQGWAEPREHNRGRSCSCGGQYGQYLDADCPLHWFKATHWYRRAERRASRDRG